jgi:hypothetical protein
MISVRSDITTKWPQKRQAFFIAINFLHQFRKWPDMAHPTNNNQLLGTFWTEENVKSRFFKTGGPMDMCDFLKFF